ncbi:hypothetical protein UFVDC4_00260 [Staphylococcus phage vB_SauM-UFV_DC4]|nr:hypothetical protein UFVDC4_00260 [Staphylococcus phage vB_SauM-UFV_DC4]
MAKNNRNKKNIRQLENNNKSTVIKNASKNTGRILFNAFIKSNPSLDAIVGDSGLKLFNNDERRLKKFSEVKGSTNDLLKTLKNKSNENDLFSSSNEKLSNEKPEYESVTEYIDNPDGTKSEIVSLSDKKKSKITNSPLVAMNNLAEINQRGFVGTNIALNNYSLSMQATNSLVDSALSNLSTIQDGIYQNTIMEENTKRNKQSKLHSILNGNISLLKYLDEKTNPENLLMGMMSGDQLKSMLMGVAKNPIEFAATQGAKIAFNKLLYGDIGGYDPEGDNKNIFNRLNKRFDPQNIGSMLINRNLDEDSKLTKGLERLTGNDNKYISNLGNALSGRLDQFKEELLGDGKGGISLKNKRKKDTPVQFDMESHTSINKVIPDFLSRLQGNLIAKKEGRSGGLADNAELGSIYNYRKGVWENRGSAKKKDLDKIKSDSLFNFKDTYLGKELLSKLDNDEERTKEVLAELTKIDKPIQKTSKLKEIVNQKNINVNTESLSEVFEKNSAKFNTDLFNIKKSISKTLDKKDNSRIMAFTEIEGLNKSNSTYSRSNNNDNINQIKDFGNINWENSDLEEIKNIFLEIERKLDNNFSNDNINNNKEFINNKVNTINNIIDKGKNFPILSGNNGSNEAHASVMDKLNSLSNAVNKAKEYKENPTSAIKDMVSSASSRVNSTQENTQPDQDDEYPYQNINQSSIIDNNPLMDLMKNIPGLNKLSINNNEANKDTYTKEPSKTIDDLTREEKEKKAKSTIIDLVKTAFGNDPTIKKDMEDSQDAGALERMKQGLSTADAGKSGEDVMSKITGSNKKEIAESIRGNINFGKGGEAEKSIGAKKMMNGMLDFSKMGPVLFAGTSAAVLGSLMKGKNGKKDLEPGKKGFLASAGGFLGNAAMLGAGGFLAAKFGPKLLSKLLPSGIGKFFTSMPGMLGKIGGGIKNIAGKFGLGKLFRGIKGAPKKIGNVFKGIGKFAKDKLPSVKSLGKMVIGKGAGLVKKGLSAGKTIGKVAKSGISKIFNKKNASAATKGISKFASKGFNRAKSIGKGLFGGAKKLGGKAFGAIGKAKNKLFGKGAMKAGGKFALKAGLKTALPFIPFVGPVIGAAMWAPDIIKTIKHPIESLKHPIKTLGSFFGIGEHPGDKIEDEAKSKEEKHTEDQTGLGRLILSTSKLMFRASPMFPLAKVGGDMFKTITDNKMKSGPKAEEDIQKDMFMSTPLGSLYQIAKGGIDFSKYGKGEIGDWFSRFLVKMEEMVVAMSKMKNSSGGDSGGDGEPEVSGEAGEVDMNTKKIVPGSINQIPDGTVGAWMKKIPSAAIWQPYGNYSGLSFNGGKHYGIDIGMLPGQKVKCMVEGTVIRSNTDPGGGNIVQVKSPGNIYSTYMHLTKQLVKKGDKVKIGQVIAISGNTGANTAGSGHLHFQINKGKPGGWAMEKNSVDPSPWIKAPLKGSKGGSDEDKGSKAGKSKKGKKGGAAFDPTVKMVDGGYKSQEVKEAKRQRAKEVRNDRALLNKLENNQKKTEEKAEKEKTKIYNSDIYNIKKIKKRVDNFIKDRFPFSNTPEAIRKIAKTVTGGGGGGKSYNKVFMVGDSIGAGAASEIRKSVSKIQINAVPSRTYSSGGPSPNGKNVLESNKKKYNKDKNAIIVQLGTNGGLTTGNVKEIEDMYDKADVYFVNTYVDPEKRKGSDISDIIEATNKAIESSDSKVIDWNSKASSDMIENDGLGVHPNSKGKKALASTIKETIGGGGSSSSASKSDEDDKEGNSESGPGASEYSFKNGTWYGSITGRDDNRMDEDEQEELNDRLMKRYAQIYGIDYEEAKKIDQEQQEKKKSEAGKKKSESGSSGSGSEDSGDEESSDSSDSSASPSKPQESRSQITNNKNIGNPPVFQLPTLANSGFSNINRGNNAVNNQGSKNTKTVNNNYQNGQSNVINNENVNKEFIKGKNRVTNHYNKIVNNHKNSKIENGNSGYTYDYEKLWYSDDLVRMLANIDKNTLASTKELDRLLEELK